MKIFFIVNAIVVAKATPHIPKFRNTMNAMESKMFRSATKKLNSATPLTLPIPAITDWAGVADINRLNGKTDTAKTGATNA